MDLIWWIVMIIVGLPYIIWCITDVIKDTKKEFKKLKREVG